jgi:homoserine dehydrogenase
VKLVARAERVRAAARCTVTPALVGEATGLGSLTGAANEVVVECNGTGPLAFRGLGAGGAPTAAALACDVVTAARNLASGTRCPLPLDAAEPPPPGVEPEARHFMRVAGGVDASAASRAAAAAAGLAVEKEARVVIEGRSHAGLVLSASRPVDAHALHQRLASLGLRPGALLPVVEVP